VKLVLGTRGSELALAQARMAELALRERCNADVQIEVVRTSGDKGAREAGRKGVFTAELEYALLDGRIDVAVHSAKDIPSEMQRGLTIAAVLPRAPVEDLLITRQAASSGLRTVATGSVRRQHQLRFFRGLKYVADLRGNVPTRLRKFTASDWDGIVLARAGLERLGFSPPRFEFEGQQFFAEILPMETFVPAGGQGIIAMQTREKDAAMISAADENAVHCCLRAEREFLRLLGGDCGTPVGAHARWVNGEMELCVQLFAGDSEPTMACARGTGSEQIAMEAFNQIRPSAAAATLRREGQR